MRTLFPEGHDVFATGLDFVEESRDWEDRQRTLSLIGDQYGVVSGLEVIDVSALTNDIQISAGLAIDALGRRVVLDNDTLVTGLDPLDIGSHVIIYQANVDLFPTAHPITGVSDDTREVDGASVVVSGAYASGVGHVLLACISDVVTGGAPTVSLSTTLRNCREELRIDPERLGTGRDTNEHRLSAHANGISGGTGSLVPSIFDAATDYIRFTAMAASNWISINGVLLGVDEINPIDGKYVYFDTGSDPSGSWNIYMDSSGSTGKTQAALTADQFLLATVTFDDGSGDLSSLVDSRIFYEMDQDLVRVDLTEAQTNDSLTQASTLRNNLNRVRYRLNALETTAGGAYPVIGNANADYVGATEAVFAQAVASLPAGGGTLVLADGAWTFSNPVVVDKPIHFVSERGSTISIVSNGITNAFSIQSDGVEFEGIVFDVNYASGGTIHLIDVADFNNFVVKDCVFALEAGGNLYGEVVRIAGGSNFVIEDNLYKTDTAQMYLVRVIQSIGNVTSGLCIKDNILQGLGSANLFHLDTGDAKVVSISHNTGLVGEAGGLRTWILSDVGTNMYSTSIVGNVYECTNIGGAVIPIFVFLSHIGGGSIVGNVLRFTDPATTFAVGISVADDFTICGNQIRDAHFGISVSDRCAVNGNNLEGITSEGINVVANNNSIVGNVLQGTGGIGIDVDGDNNIIDGNSVIDFVVGIQNDGANNFLKITDNTSNKVV